MNGKLREKVNIYVLGDLPKRETFLVRVYLGIKIFHGFWRCHSLAWPPRKDQERRRVGEETMKEKDYRLLAFSLLLYVFLDCDWLKRGYFMSSFLPYFFLRLSLFISFFLLNTEQWETSIDVEGSE